MIVWQLIAHNTESVVVEQSEPEIVFRWVYLWRLRALLRCFYGSEANALPTKQSRLSDYCTLPSR